MRLPNSIACCNPLILAFAGISIAYLAASIVYVIVTTVCKYGTPFKDSLSASQRKIMKKSSDKRKKLFYSAFAVCIVCLGLLYGLAQQQSKA